jgi:hypothetical protein
VTTTYRKLRSGVWGLRVEGSTWPGAVVTVVKRSGETKTERVGRVLWAGEGVSLCTIKRDEPPAWEKGYDENRSTNCSRCCYVPGERTAQLWEDCSYCGTEPVYV